MTISRMQNPKQLKGNGGILTLADAKRMAPPGESLAYINKDEAKLLKSRGGAGEDINGTGIKSYFLKKIFKKAKRAVKKVVKSPIGKAALLGAGAMYAGGLGPFASSSSMFGGKLAGLKGAGFLRGTGSGILSGLTGGGDGFLGQIGNVFRVGGDADNKFSALRLLGGGLGAAALAAPFMMGGDEEEVVEDTPFTQTPDSIASIVNMARNQDPSLRFLPKPKFVDNFYAADGGLATMRPGYNQGEMVEGVEAMPEDENMMMAGMGNVMKLFETPYGFDRSGFEDMLIQYEDSGAKQKGIKLMEFATDFLGMVKKDTPVMDTDRVPAAEGGIMDLGGLEKDYREGGFVPLGEEERADDVPARLSKNEFVFTADAVRAAGGGDIDQGAEVMQNMMDNLEAGGTISEESQGMNPAQEMFDQSQMLENRIA